MVEQGNPMDPLLVQEMETIKSDVRLMRASLDRLVEVVEKGGLITKIAVLESTVSTQIARIISIELTNKELKQEIDVFKWKLIGTYGTLILMILAQVMAFVLKRQ